MNALSLISVVKSSIKYLGNILQGIKNKSGGIRILLERVKGIAERLEKGQEIVPAMIDLLSGLDASQECELRNINAIEKAIAVSLDIMKKLGAKPLCTKIGEIFDPKIHCAVGTKDVDLPDGTILEVVFRGFRVEDKPYYTQVIVARNVKERAEKENNGGVKVALPQGSGKKAKDCGQSHKLDWPIHGVYQQKVRERLIPLLKEQETIAWLNKNEQEVWSVFNLNLDAVRSKVIALYSGDKRGNPPCDPFGILRSFLLMALMKETRITSWAADVKASTMMSIVCGFKPGEAPAVGTYYEFFKRLENGPYKRKCQHRILESEMRHARNPYRMPKEKPKEKPKREPPEEGVLKKLVAELKSQENEPLPNDLEKRLNEILTEVAVKPSAEKGLLGDGQKLAASGDGSVVPSCAASNGKTTCDCRKQGIYKCDHLRKFSDLDGQWGWDNEVKDFVFGYRYYQIVCGEKTHDLPLYLSISSANTHEAVMMLKLLARFEKECKSLMPSVKIRKGAFDAIHDAYPVYNYLVDKRIQYAIPYAREPKRCTFLGDSEIMANEKGVPLCPKGLLMRYHSKDKNGGHVYACPVKRPTHRDGKYVYECHRNECPQEALCEPASTLGPLVRIPCNLDPRIHPEIPRESQEYKTLLASRTTCERSNSAKKYAYLMKTTRTRVMAYSFVRLALISIIEHVRAWILEQKKAEGDLYPGILERMRLQTNAT